MVRTTLVLLVAVALGVGRAAPAQGQEVTGWIAVQVWECPAGMTAATLDPWSCWVTTGAYDVFLAAGDGTPLLGLGDALFDGWTHTWQWLAVGTADWPVPYQIVQSGPPAGSLGWVVRYAMNEGPGETVWLSDVAFGADLHIYNFF